MSRRLKKYPMNFYSFDKLNRFGSTHAVYPWFVAPAGYGDEMVLVVLEDPEFPNRCGETILAQIEKIIPLGSPKDLFKRPEDISTDAYFTVFTKRKTVAIKSG